MSRIRNVGKPYDLVKQGSATERARKARAELGLPLIERALKSPNVETEELAGGRKRTRHRFLLTTPEARKAAYEEIKQAQQAGGTFGRNRIYIPETAADRFLGAEAHEALCWFLRIHVALNFPRIKSIHGPDEQRIPRACGKAHLGNFERTLYDRVRACLSKPMLVFLDWLARHEYVMTEGGEVESHNLVGRRIIDSRDWRRGEGGLEGYLAAAAEDIEHWRLRCAARLKSRVTKS